MKIETLKQIEAAWDAVTDADLARAERSFEPVGAEEAILGEARWADTRRMWAAGMKCDRDELQALTKSRYDAESAEEAQSLRAAASHSSALGDLCRDIFWVEVKQDLGEQALLCKGIGIRSGWILVKASPQNPMARVLGSMLTGGE